MSHLAGKLAGEASRSSSPRATCASFPKSCCGSKGTVFIQSYIQQTFTEFLPGARYSAKCWWSNGKQNGHDSCLYGIYSLVWNINNPTNMYSRKLCSYYERKYRGLWKNIIRGLNLYGELFLLKDIAHIKHYLCMLFVNMKILGTMWALNVHSSHSQWFTIKSCCRFSKYRTMHFPNVSAFL